jgi:4-diphosphocytidyl-2-C-methyl-D-erythritol kinase
MTIEAPAKINFGLRIMGRRSDGYHLLESLFVPLELADELSLSVVRGPVPGDGPRIEVELVDGDAVPGCDSLPRDDRNLAVRAAHAFLRAAGSAVEDVAAIRIVLRKCIPAAAGLGGGSSDAAAVLRGLAEQLPEGPTGSELARTALDIGADVPFFLDPRPALVRGIGEQIEPFEGLPKLTVVLANPGISLSTAAVYRLFDALSGAAPAGLTAADPGPTMRALSGLGGDPNALARLPGFSNDLEAAAIRLCPPIARLRDGLRDAGALWAGMSGSGATVYGVFGTEAEAIAAQEGAARSRNTWTCVTRFRI